MPETKKEPTTMINFLLTNMDIEDQETASQIRPLPVSVVPSGQFVAQTRAFLMEVIAGNSNQRAA